MANLYLQVPFAEKDQAKALGARWDAARKKWYVPEGGDAALFSRWKLDISHGGEPPAVPAKAVKPMADAGGLVTVAHTQPLDPNFVPYSGSEPPWE